MGLFSFILLNILCFLDLDVCLLSNIWKFSTIISLNKLFAALFLSLFSFWDFSTVYTGPSDVVPYILSNISPLFHSFYFYSSYWMNSTALFLKSPILSSDWSSLLLSPSIKYLVIVFFSSVIPAWTFQCFVSLCWNSYFAHSLLSWPQWASLRQFFWTFY